MCARDFATARPTTAATISARMQSPTAIQTNHMLDIQATSTDMKWSNGVATVFGTRSP
jgi:hypothetical protein